jgi:hypothetical protein
MPAFETMDLREKAVLWPAVATDKYGEATVGEPREIWVRWETKLKQVIDAKGEQSIYDATVIVEEDVAVGSHIWLGELADWYGTASQFTDDYVGEVVDTSNTPSIKATNRRRVLGVKWLRDEQ